MGAPFEGDAIKFIGSKRPLKGAILLIAAIGVIGSTFTTVRPLIEWARPLAFHYPNINPQRAEPERYECAHPAGAARWNLPQAFKVALSQITAVVAVVPEAVAWLRRAERPTSGNRRSKSYSSHSIGIRVQPPELLWIARKQGPPVPLVLSVGDPAQGSSAMTPTEPGSRGAGAPPKQRLRRPRSR